MMQVRLKRLIDVLVAGVSLVLVSPVLLITWLAIKIEDKGPALYISKRVGRAYQVFDLYKFRSMYVDADQRMDELGYLNQYATDDCEPSSDNCPHCSSLGDFCSPVMVRDNGLVCERRYLVEKSNRDKRVFVKFKNDPRTTRVGKFIRKTSIDELPQLINVLFGDMSIVGNRPLPLYEAECLTKDAAVARFSAPAGLTGLWQITKRGTSVTNGLERIDLDNDYAAHQSITGDLLIMLKTIPALIKSEEV